MKEGILVFGALGRMGSAVIKNLPEDTLIRAADLSLDGDYPSNVEAVVFDMNQQPADYASLFAGINRMFLLWPPGTSVKEVMPPLIEAAVDHGVKQVVFLSILGADKLRVVPHRSVEQMLEGSGMDWVFLRSAYFMQNLSGIHAPEIRERDEIFLPAGGGEIGLVDVRDVAEVAAKALLEGHKNKAYSLTGPTALTFSEIADVFSDVLGRKITYANPGVLRFQREMRQRDVPGGLAAFMVIEYLMTKLGKSGLVTDEVERQLGRPATPLDKFVADFADCW
jgi:uncharacterized protein YbjT (DUF2867 family)